jgi:hypothetical protein
MGYGEGKKTGSQLRIFHSHIKGFGKNAPPQKKKNVHFEEGVMTLQKFLKKNIAPKIIL